MEDKKIDILNDINQIISENFETGDRKFYDISLLDSEQLISYNSFMNLVKSKTSEPYTHIFISDNPVKRFVNIKNNDSEEVLYDSFSNEDKITFDTFFNLFTL